MLTLQKQLKKSQNYNYAKQVKTKSTYLLRDEKEQSELGWDYFWCQGTFAFNLQFGASLLLDLTFGIWN